MADCAKQSITEETLKPFYQRASLAEDRLSRLEAALTSKKDAGNEELLEAISELQAKLDNANAELVLEREKAQKLEVENAKLQYRTVHLVRALKDADLKLESLRGGISAEVELDALNVLAWLGHESASSAQTIAKLEDLRL